MPPLRGIGRGINGELLKALEETGHGDRIVVVDPSYSIPEEAQSVDYQGESSTLALAGILKLVPQEFGSYVIMDVDDPTEEETALEQEFVAAFKMNNSNEMYVRPDVISRLTEGDVNGFGFYELVNNAAEATLFVRTRDRRPYACASFIVGHSQY